MSPGAAALLVKGYVTLKDIASRLGYRDESGLRHAIRAGRLAAEKAGTTYVVAQEEAERFIEEAQKPHRGWPRGQERPRRPTEEQGGEP